MQRKYWMDEPEKMLIIDLPQESDIRYINALMDEFYSVWSNPDESYDDEEIVEEIYDMECAVFLMQNLHETLTYKSNWRVEDCWS